MLSRVAMSSFLREAEHGIFYAEALLAHWAANGARVLNGADVARGRLLQGPAALADRGLGLAVPETRVVHRREDLLAAAADAWRWPLLVKANVGGSGAGIVRYCDEAELAESVAEGTVPASVDRFCWSRTMCRRAAGRSLRVETLGGKFLYAIEVESGGDGFDLCPADACLAQPGRAAVRMTAVEPPAELIEAAERIAGAAGLDVGGIEYHDRRPRRRPLLRHQRPVQFRREAAGRARLGAARPAGRFPRGRHRGRAAMRFGYWMPVFGGWLRNIADEGMEASWDYVRRLTLRSEETGWDLSLIAELNLNDIKGVEAPALDAWSTAAALAAVTERIELMVAVRPNFHQPALFAKQAANIDNISGGRLSLNVVSSWWADEATQYGLQFDQHDDRYARTREWLDVVDGLWTQKRFSLRGRALPAAGRDLRAQAGEPAAADHLCRRRERGGQDDDRRAMRRLCHARRSGRGDRRRRSRTWRQRREQAGGAADAATAWPPTRSSATARRRRRRELERITALPPEPPAGFDNFDQWLSGHRSSSGS